MTERARVPAKEPARGESPAPPAARQDVALAVNRCPYCHVSVRAEEAAVCSACLARHHEPCALESRECGACRSREFLQRPGRAPTGLAALVFVSCLGGALTGTCGPVSSNDALYLLLPAGCCFLAGIVHPRPRAAALAPALFLLSFFVTTLAWVLAGWTGHHAIHFGAVTVVDLVLGALAALAGVVVARRSARAKAAATP